MEVAVMVKEYKHLLHVSDVEAAKLFQQEDKTRLEELIKTARITTEFCEDVLSYIDSNRPDLEQLSMYAYKKFLETGIAIRMPLGFLINIIEISVRDESYHKSLVSLLADTCSIGYNELDYKVTTPFTLKVNVAKWRYLYDNKLAYAKENWKGVGRKLRSVEELNYMLTEPSTLYDLCNVLADASEIPMQSVVLISKGLVMCDMKWLIAGLCTLYPDSDYNTVRDMLHIAEFTDIVTDYVNSGGDSVHVVKIINCKTYSDEDDELKGECLIDYMITAPYYTSLIKLPSNAVIELFPDITRKLENNTFNRFKCFMEIDEMAKKSGKTRGDIISDLRSKAPTHLENASEETLLLELWEFYKNIKS